MGYKSTHSFETRCAESERVSRKYLDRVPVICERLEGSAITAVDKIKFLVPLDLTVGQFCFALRRRIALTAEKGMFLFMGEVAVIPETSTSMGKLYLEKRDADGFLYMRYSGENTFGF